jgi:uncharacterized protein YjbI with pentapeptide repeats
MWRQRIPKQLFWAAAAGAAVILVLFVLWGGPWLFTLHADHALTAEQELKAQNDVRTTLVQAVAGLAVAAGAVVTYRTFRQVRIEQDRTYRLNQSQQVTDTYAKAVEQLGHDKAPVRLGAMYSLEGLAQDDPSRRQTVVDVLCAYLRMPYTPPNQGESAADRRTDNQWMHRFHGGTDRQPNHDPAQELQVRQTAQRLLAHHLRRPAGISGQNAQTFKGSPHEGYWPATNVDLTGATLIGLSLRDVSVGDAAFDGAIFFGDASFSKAAFSHTAGFDGATFYGSVTFDEATFSGAARFDGVTFSDAAVFAKARFSGYAGFRRAAFSGPAWFAEAIFSGLVWFEKAEISGDALFDKTTFSGTANFGEATFSGAARFEGATFFGTAGFWRTTFSGLAGFQGATFSDDASFTGATFSDTATFDGATFSGPAWFGTFSDASFIGAHILRLDVASLNTGGETGWRRWPHGWTVQPDADDSTRGTLISTVENTAALATPLSKPGRLNPVMRASPHWSPPWSRSMPRLRGRRGSPR